MRSYNHSVSSIWRTIAVAVIGLQAEQTLAMTMMGPSIRDHHSTGLMLAQTSAESQTVGAPLADGAETEPVDNDPCHNKLNSIFNEQMVQKEPADVLLSFIQDYCQDAADEFLPKIVSPYFCFYTGSVLVTKVKEAATKKPAETSKKELISEYCTAMDTKGFAARKNLLDRTLHGKPCIEAYQETMTSEVVSKFDPISTAISARAMCAEFVKEINELLEMQKSSLPNAVRYSYLVSQQVDLQTELINTYSSCIVSEAEANPRQTCINIMVQPTFDMYNSERKADVCQIVTSTWNDQKALSDGTGEKKPDICALMTSHIFQSYSDYLQDLSDAIIGSLTEKMSQQVGEATGEYETQKNEQEVKRFLKQQKSDKTVQEGRKMVSDIEANNVATQAKNEQEAKTELENRAKEKEVNSKVVQSNLPEMQNIAKQDQQSHTTAMTNVTGQDNVDKIVQQLNQIQAQQLQQPDINAVSNFLGNMNAPQPVQQLQYQQSAQQMTQPQQMMQQQQVLAQPSGQPQMLAQTMPQQQPQQQQYSGYNYVNMPQTQQPQQLMQMGQQPQPRMMQQYATNLVQTGATTQAQPYYQAIDNTNMLSQTQAQPMQTTQFGQQMMGATAQPVYQRVAAQPMQLAQTQVQVQNQPAQLAQVSGAQQGQYNNSGWLSPITNFIGF